MTLTKFSSRLRRTELLGYRTREMTDDDGSALRVKYRENDLVNVGENTGMEEILHEEKNSLKNRMRNYYPMIRYCRHLRGTLQVCVHLLYERGISFVKAEDYVLLL